MPTGGTLLYRCDVCGVRTETIHVPDLALAMTLLAASYPNPAQLPRDTGTVAHMGIHQCGDNMLGLTRFFGGREDA